MLCGILLGVHVDHVQGVPCRDVHERCEQDCVHSMHGWVVHNRRTVSVHWVFGWTVLARHKHELFDVPVRKLHNSSYVGELHTVCKGVVHG